MRIPSTQIRFDRRRRGTRRGEWHWTDRSGACKTQLGDLRACYRIKSYSIVVLVLELGKTLLGKRDLGGRESIGHTGTFGILDIRTYRGK